MNIKKNLFCAMQLIFILASQAASIDLSRVERECSFQAKMLWLQHALDVHKHSLRQIRLPEINACTIVVAYSSTLLRDVLWFPPSWVQFSGSWIIPGSGSWIVPGVPTAYGLFQAGPAAYRAYMGARLRAIEFEHDVMKLAALNISTGSTDEAERKRIRWFLNEGRSQVRERLMSEVLQCHDKTFRDGDETSFYASLNNQTLGVTAFLLDYEAWRKKFLHAYGSLDDCR